MISCDESVLINGEINQINFNSGVDYLKANRYGQFIGGAMSPRQTGEPPMSFRLPTADHPARELMGDVSTVAETLHPANVGMLLSTMQARRNSERFFDGCKAARRVCYIIIRAESDERWLISFGRRGGWRKEWNFGTGRAA